MNSSYSNQIGRPEVDSITPKRVPAVETAFNRLEGQQERLMKAFSTLASRIQPVCRQVPATPTQSGKDVEGADCQLAERILGASRTAENLANQIEDCTNRIEL